MTMKAGEFKDTGNPARDLTPAEQAYLQGLIDNMHTQFIEAVAEGRKAKVEDIRSIANGKVWTGEQALPLKLVDPLGDFEMAVKDTAKSVNIKGEPQLVKPGERAKISARFNGWGRLGIPADQRETARAAHGLLLLVEVAHPRRPQFPVPRPVSPVENFVHVPIWHLRRTPEI